MDGHEQALQRVTGSCFCVCAGAGKPSDADIRADGGPTASISGKRAASPGTGAKGAAGKAGGGAKAPEATTRLVEVRISPDPLSRAHGDEVSADFCLSRIIGNAAFPRGRARWQPIQPRNSLDAP